MADITEDNLEQNALKNISPNIPPDVISEAVRKITRTESPSLIENNRRFHLLSPRQTGKSDTNRFGAVGSASVRSGYQHDEKDVMMLAPSSELTNQRFRFSVNP